MFFVLFTCTHVLFAFMIHSDSVKGCHNSSELNFDFFSKSCHLNVMKSNQTAHLPMTSSYVTSHDQLAFNVNEASWFKFIKES